MAMFLPPNSGSPHRSMRRPRRHGLTLVELMMVITILVMMAGAMASLATVVESGSSFNQENSEASQYGRVALERIERALASANASEQFPGCIVFSEQINGWTYPDTLVVWHAKVPIINPDGQPMVNELVVFCPNPTVPNELLEIRLNDATGPAPDLSNASAWQLLMAEFKSGNNAQRVPLTDLLRTAVSTGGDVTSQRGVVRFDVKLRPSADEWEEFQMGSRVWSDLSWAQGIHGAETGLRQTWCRIELQLQLRQFAERNGSAAESSATSEETTIPFFGSGAIYHELHRS